MIEEKVRQLLTFPLSNRHLEQANSFCTTVPSFGFGLFGSTRQRQLHIYILLSKQHIGKEACLSSLWRLYKKTCQIFVLYLVLRAYLRNEMSSIWLGNVMLHSSTVMQGTVLRTSAKEETESNVCNNYCRMVQPYISQRQYVLIFVHKGSLHFPLTKTLSTPWTFICQRCSWWLRVFWYIYPQSQIGGESVS